MHHLNRGHGARSRHPSPASTSPALPLEYPIPQRLRSETTMAAPSPSTPRPSATSAPSPRPRTSPARAAPYSPSISSSSSTSVALLPLPKLPSTLSRNRYTSTTRENMNCKSCRKRKIKCSRTRPSCNACDVFRCECLYDAVPKKRGPKTEVLEELLKRIDGLERRLEEGPSRETQHVQPAPIPQPALPLPPPPVELMTPSPAPVTPPVIMEMQAQEETRDWRGRLVDVFFSRVNGRPYGFFHEPSFRADFAAGRFKEAVLNSVCAASVRFVPFPGLPSHI